MRVYYAVLTGFLLTGLCAKHAAGQEKLQWWDPVKSGIYAIQGQAWHEGLAAPYDRLPAGMKQKVRKPVWNLSRDAAGLILRFRTNASQIHVRYAVSGHVDRPHMPATGVSGVDLYALDASGHWQWSAGKYHFGDTITYDFTHLRRNNPGGGWDYYLYLPSYNHVRWLEVGVPGMAVIQPSSPSPEKPVVVYGTSIAQGLVASRPGMSWTAQLGRLLHLPVINLAFSGNGRLEDPIIGLMEKINARLYVLDCMPNMWYDFIPSDTVRARLKRAVKSLKKAHPYTPILLAEDADVSIMPLDTSRYESYNRVNAITRAMFEELKKEGIKGLYLLTADEVGLNAASTTEGTHPNDHGMWQYAQAYEKKIREIFSLTR
jgi:hypothetical protein